MSLQPPARPGPATVTASVAAPLLTARRPVWARLPMAALRTSRPRQWPKNLLVFAAPVTGSALGRSGTAMGEAVAAFIVFTLAASSVYFVNDVLDAERDRQHPRKCLRPIACGDLAETHALTMAALCALGAVLVGLLTPGLGLTLTAVAYLAVSLLYCTRLKHVPFVELTVVASGFVLRALGGASAAKVPPSGWFVLVCSLGALLVVVAKRYTELASLGGAATAHRPSLRYYSPGGLRLSQRLITLSMVAAYCTWAATEADPWTVDWHLASTVPLIAALVRFDRLTAAGSTRHIEDLLVRDTVMVCLELTWLVVFVVGLATHDIF
ncbi:decaprenyl-phosphate phosphoribosyltransferase [Streptacidiphilus albus]|uniref:decaprenyl-phosphate phosphoribosyltransferase n=1 Tax=Streptacidiphilus albus TaxID=105425 RepID=UPI00068A72F1|nr:decaprenyl-phosphate phosphoribosyltransferase [Streptacidiphilus albus]